MATNRQTIRSVRKGSVQWSEEDRMQIGSFLLKAGYVVKIGRQPIPGQGEKRNTQMEYFIEYWEE